LVPFCGLKGRPWKEVLKLTARNVADIADIGKRYGIRIQLEPIAWSPVHSLSQSIKVIEEACQKLSRKHKEHIEVYGAGNESRLTGLHETCGINEFRYGVSDRGASIRIPVHTAKNGCGYLEDRRPAANMDPYQVCAKLIETICGE